MILYKSSILTLDYQPASDIIRVVYPDLQGHLVPEVKHTIDIMVDLIKNYDIKKVILDSTNTTSSVSEAESREISTYLAAALMKTRVVKVARVQSQSIEAETRVKGTIQHVHQVYQLPFELQNFTSTVEAAQWLNQV